MVHPFEIEVEVALPADPERVWEAIATGPGIDSWFMGRNEVEGRVGGVAAVTNGWRREEAEVTAFEPGKRFASRTAEAEDGRFMAFEYLLEGRDGGSTVLRVVHSGMLGDDWQDEYDALRRGWPFHLNTLREYLAYFPGRVAEPVFGVAPVEGRSAQQIRTLLAEALGLPALVAVGDRADGGPEGLPVVAGEVVWADEERFEVRTEDAIYAFHHGAGVALMFHHLFGPVTDAAEGAWQRWLSEVMS
ncbi:SRPBCC domain-containing protein [Catenulispora yoronensis]|uniref:SRPBCC domain-containing protein n=1 Tax=Catenulispora yoronensis TaxID=450799 RepID=A0ABP5GN23_9ACTN